ncbi:MAG: hypothetical protein JW932_06160 [Deltaproteobacteria bacterium]|nr:hypothetical protein [Deltaproteobacteria bacterium]
MNETLLLKRIENIDNELEILREYHQNDLIELRGEIDRLKLELVVFRKFLEKQFPDFPQRFKEDYVQTIHEFNPEFD